MENLINRYLDKFKEIRGTDGSISVSYDGSHAEEFCQYVLEKNYRKIIFMPGEHNAIDLEPILPLKDSITGLLLDSKINYSYLNQFSKLTFLSIPDNGKDIVNLENFPNLEVLMCNFTKRLLGLGKCINLNSLTINNYFSTKQDLSELPLLPHLKDLNLFQSKIESLNGISKYHNLSELTLYGLTKLEDISDLQLLSDSLTEVDIENCKKIKDYGVLGFNKKLQSIRIANSEEINSLAFVKNIENLKNITFWGSNVLDGNISYCVGINYVSFNNKKHYSHKSEDFKQ